jgi:hypothetical protein
VFKFLRQAGLEGGELWGGEGEDVDGARGEVLEFCHFVVAVSFGKGVGRCYVELLRFCGRIVWTDLLSGGVILVV